MTNKSVIVFALTFGFSPGVMAQCYFSADARSMLSVEYDYYHDWDSIKATHYFHYKTWQVEDGGYELKETGRFHDSITQPMGAEGALPSFILPASLRQNFPVACDQNYTLNELDSLVSFNVDASGVRRLSCERGWCSRGCSWTSSYRMNVQVSMSIRGENVWNEQLDPLYTVTVDYIAWEKKPVRHSRLYFQRYDEETMSIQVYWSAQLKTFFVSAVYYEKEYVPEAHPEFHQKAFLIRV